MMIDLPPLPFQGTGVVVAKARKIEPGPFDSL
jgi:hypothetical protein